MAVKIVPGVNDLETWCIQNSKEILLDEWIIIAAVKKKNNRKGGEERCE